MKYKPGDKVRIKSLDWYNANKNSEGVVNFNNLLFFDELMSEFCGKVVTIDAYIPRGNYYEIEEDGKVNLWSDDMIEGLADEVVPQDKMISLNDACEWMKNTIDDDVFINCGSVVKFMSASEFVEYFRESMER